MEYVIAFCIGYYIGIKIYEWIVENDGRRK